MSKVIVIGAGFSGLATACYLQKAGFEVSIVDSHSQAGGRARQFEKNGFVFDTGPSWYWMPDVIEKFFADFGKKPSDYFHLQRLQPSYRIFWEDQTEWDIPIDEADLKQLLESEEKNAFPAFEKFMWRAEENYRLSMKEGLVDMTGLKWGELLHPNILRHIFNVHLFFSIKKHIASHFKSAKIRRWLEFPVLFLGATAENIPALYSLMNYADTKLGTWYPDGGMYKLAEAMQKLALSLGVEFKMNTEVQKINIENHLAQNIVCHDGNILKGDIIVSAADYHFTEQHLLDKPYRNYSAAYWDKKQFSPSAFLYYIGVDKKLKNLHHHNLFFDESMDDFSDSLYQQKSWSDRPLFYLNCPSITDAKVSPEGKENLFLLIPIPAGISGDTKDKRTAYFETALSRIEKRTQQDIKSHLLFVEDFGLTDFEQTYHSFKGNAYGLANTLLQTAHLKPKCRNKKVANLFYTGQLTVPGPGVPPSLISGKIVAHLILNTFSPSPSL